MYVDLQNSDVSPTSFPLWDEISQLKIVILTILLKMFQHLLIHILFQAVIPYFSLFFSVQAHRDVLIVRACSDHLNNREFGRTKL